MFERPSSSTKQGTYLCLKPFFAFAGSIAEVREAIRQAVERCRATKGSLSIVPWTDLDVSGRLIQREVLAKIDKSAIFLADISVLNMNVSYEAGYAIGTHKPIRLVVNDITNQI